MKIKSNLACLLTVSGIEFVGGMTKEVSEKQYKELKKSQTFKDLEDSGKLKVLDEKKTESKAKESVSNATS